MAKIVCSSCGESIAPENIDLSTRLAKCACGNVFDLSPQVRDGDAASPSARRRDLVAPSGWTVEGAVPRTPIEADGSYRARVGASSAPLVLTRRWFRPYAIFLALFCTVWDSFLVFWYGAALTAVPHHGAPPGGLVMMFVAPLIHVALGVGLTYYALALFLNRTVVRLDGRDASVTHAPLFWRGNQQISLAGLRSVFVRRDKPALGQRNREVWTVLLDTDANPSLALLDGVPSEQDARFVAAHIAEREGVPGP